MQTMRMLRAWRSKGKAAHTEIIQLGEIQGRHFWLLSAMAKTRVFAEGAATLLDICATSQH